MKRCPSCNQKFDEAWLSFCTHDGTTLVDDSAALNPPAPTVLSPHESHAPAAPPTWVTPSADLPPTSPQWQPSQPATPIWRPPPPPYVQPENKNLAIAAMTIGIISVTVGWLCLGPIPGIAAIIMGAVALSQIKKTPDRVGGKPMAVVGVVTGGVTVLIYAGLLIFYLILFIAAANS